jgi:hypothetical protein
VRGVTVQNWTDNINILLGYGHGYEQAVLRKYATILNTAASLRKESGIKNPVIHILIFLQSFFDLEETKYLRLTPTGSRRPQYEDL